jgi:hypothetical protein
MGFLVKERRLVLSFLVGWLLVGPSSSASNYVTTISIRVSTHHPTY